MQTIFDVIIFAAGFGACWACKDTMRRFVTGTEAQVKSLETRLASLRTML